MAKLRKVKMLSDWYLLKVYLNYGRNEMILVFLRNREIPLLV
jgi:hypothetical protein